MKKLLACFVLPAAILATNDAVIALPANQAQTPDWLKMTGFGTDNRNRYFAILQEPGLIKAGEKISLLVDGRKYNVTVISIGIEGVHVRWVEVAPPVPPKKTAEIKPGPEKDANVERVEIAPPPPTPEKTIKIRPGPEMRDPFWPVGYADKQEEV